MRRRVELWYPRNKQARGPNEATEIEVDLIDVRAANSIVVDYDFDRDGYCIRMPTIFEWGIDDKVCDEGLVEVAFVHAWATGDPDELRRKT